MQRFMCTHTIPPGSVTRQQAEQISQASQQDPQVHGCESFMNLSEGRIICILDAPDRQTLHDWFNKMGVPVDEIVPVELQGEHGHIREATPEFTGAGASA